MGNNNSVEKYNDYESFEASILSNAIDELKLSVLNSSRFNKFSIIAGSVFGIGAVTGVRNYGLTESYFSEDLEKRYKAYIKNNYAKEFNEHKNDVTYIEALFTKAVQSLKTIMSSDRPIS